jgi:hypothetical protein
MILLMLQFITVSFCVSFFFLTCPHKRGGIRTSDLRFIRRSPTQLSYLLETYLFVLVEFSSAFIYFNGAHYII